jgi:glycosyltransferase involved in cell wall biosynthesis
MASVTEGPKGDAELSTLSGADLSVETPLSARLRAENARLRQRIIELEADSEDAVRSLHADLDDAMRENADRRQAVRALDREVIQLRAMLAEAERQMGNIRQTFIYRIGETIVSARTAKGLRQLPRRLVALRRAYLEKRGLLSTSVVSRMGYSERLRYVEAALALLAAEGVEAATDYVRSAQAHDPEDTARALLEIAHAVWRQDPAQAASLAVEAGAVNELDPRLRSLVLSLFDHGEVDAPALMLSTLSETLTATPADRGRRETILAYERQLASPLKIPARLMSATGPVCVAVVASRSLPHHLQAETFRAQAVMDAAREAGLSAFLVTQPGYQYPATGNGEPAARLFNSTHVIRMPPVDFPPGVFDRYVPAVGGLLAAEFTARGVTCVHAVGELALSAAACWAARASGASFTLDLGDSPTIGGHIDDGWIGRERFRSSMALLAEIARAADRCIVRSRAVDRAFSELGVSLDAELIVDFAAEQMSEVSQNEVGEIRSQLGLTDEKVIGVYDSLDTDEGLYDLLDALPAVRAAAPDCVIVYIGAGHGAEALRQRAVTRGLIDHVRIAPDLARRRMADCLSLFDVAAFPKRRNSPLGVAAPVELQAALTIGIPVVATNNAWSREWIVDGATGLSVEGGDVEALARAIIGLLGPAGLAPSISRSGRDLVRARASAAIVHPQVVSTFSGRNERAAA